MVRSPKACLPLSLSGSSPLRRRSFPAPCLLRAVERILDASVWHSPVPYGPKKEGMAEVRGKKDAMPPY